MKDCTRRNIEIGDMVAVVYHPKAYEFSIETGKVVRFTKQHVVVDLIGCPEVRFKFDEDDVVTRIVKLDVDKKMAEENEPEDAIGQKIEVGMDMAFRKPIELGNTCKGFQKAGKITRMTASCVYYKDEDGKEIRRNKNLIIVL